MPVPRITREELTKRLDTTAEASRPIVVDARLKYPFEHSSVTLPKAVRLDPSGTVPQLAKGRDIVVYDSDPEELVSAPVVARLRRDGYTAFALVGGIGEWLAAKLPTDAKDAPQQAPPKAGALAKK